MVKRPKTGDVISMIKIRFQPEKMIPVDELVPHPKNRNAHPKDQIERLADILKAQGWRYPIKVSNQSGFITSGHGRLEAAKLLGMKEVPVSFQDYEDEALEYADLIADNAIASWSELDFSGINSDIGDLGPDFNIDLLGIQNFFVDVSEKPLEKEWQGMPEFNQDDKTSFRHVIVHFVNEDDAKDFFRIIGQNDTGKTKSIWFPPQERMDTESKRY